MNLLETNKMTNGSTRGNDVQRCATAMNLRSSPPSYYAKIVRMRESNTVDLWHHPLRGTKWDQAREIATLSIHDLIHGHLFELVGLRLRCQRDLPWTLLRHEVISVVRQDVLSKPEFLLSNCVQTMSSLHIPDKESVNSVQPVSAHGATSIVSTHVQKRGDFEYHRCSTGERITRSLRLHSCPVCCSWRVRPQTLPWSWLLEVCS